MFLSWFFKMPSILLEDFWHVTEDVYWYLSNGYGYRPNHKLAPASFGMVDHIQDQ